MPRPDEDRPRSAVWISRLALVGVLSIGSAAGAQPLPNARPAEADANAEIGNIFPTAPRELRQNLSRAQAAIADERFSDAAEELGQILDNPTSDDYFLGLPGQADAQQSLKTEALALIDSMPAKGRQIYETKFGFDAKAQLDKALAEGSLAGLTEVSRRYFHTKAGYEATLLLGRTLLDQGRPLAAALSIKRVADSPVAAAQYDPELSVLLATCWAHARMPEKATETLVVLRQRMPQAKVRLLDGEEPLFSSDDQALAWLERIVGGGRTPLSLVESQWVMYRGNEARNAASAGGVPLLNYRWSLPTVNDPQDELKVKSLVRSLRDRGEPNIVALQPLVVQDTAIVRAPDSSKLLGVDLRTGKRKWVFPPFDDGPSLQAGRNAALGRPQGVNLRDQELRQRVWEDHAFGQVSSDGQRVYVIDDLGYAAAGNMSGPRVIVGPGGRNIMNSGWAKPHNQLVALDLKREGYQVWAVGGTLGDNPALAGAFFLGPPLPLGDQLYAIVEMQSEIRLVCLSAATGELEWKQQLAVVEDNQQIVLDRVRRLAGASPSLADGVLICPTSAGAAVAVDLATRSLRWGYQYPRWDVIRRNTGAFGVRTSYATPGAEQRFWLDATATIADGCVVLTPVESQELHCLDLLTGKARWPAQPRDDMLFVACVHGGKIVLVGRNKVRAINLADGKPAWSAPIDLGNDTPAGRGFYSGKFYQLPLSNQQLAKLDLDEGKIVSRAKTEVDLGNVVCYQDQLLSQSAQHVASFYLSEPLLAWIDETLKTDPDNAKALSLKGQVLLQEGKRNESLALLRRAVAANPQDLAARSLLVKVMIALVKEDFAANFALAEELDTLVTDPAQKRDVLRWRAAGLAKAGRTEEAFAALLALAEQASPSGAATSADDGALESSEPDLAVRSDRWLAGQLAGLLRGADAPTRERMTAEIQSRLDTALRSDSSIELREFVQRFGFHPLGDRAQLALADKLIATEQFLEAELLAAELLAAADRPLAGWARATLATIYEQSRRHDLAARFYHELRTDFADVVCCGGLTGRQLAERAAESATLAALATGAWPAGRVDVTRADAADPRDRNVAYSQLRYQISLTHQTGAVLPGLRASVDPSNAQQILVRDDAGRQLATASLRGADNTYRWQTNIPYNISTGRVNGHLVVVNLGDQIVAIDALRGERAGSEGLLWKLDAVDLDPTNGRTAFYPQQRTTLNPVAGGRTRYYDPTGRINLYTGPVLRQGVYFQRGRTLHCVDPLTGAALWERGQIPASAEIFGDGELIFVADPVAEQALVLSAIDGSLLGRRQLERSEHRWTTHGRNVLAWEPAGSEASLKLYDAWGSDASGNDASGKASGKSQPLWSKTVASTSRGVLIDDDELAVLEPNGTFTIVSLATGKVRFAAPLDPDPALSFIQVLRSRQQYVLITSQDNPDLDNRNGFMSQPVGMGASQLNRIHGRVYAFDRHTGKAQWQVPAFIAHHALPADQPSESPLLLFVRNKILATGGAPNARVNGSVLCLDRRDGRIVWDSEAETDAARQVTGQIALCDISADPARHTVTLHLVAQAAVKSITLALTDQPVAPQPPAQTGELSSASVGQRTGAIDTSIGEAFELLNRGLNPARRGLVPDIQVPPGRRAIPRQP